MSRVRSKTANDPVKRVVDFHGIPIELEWLKGETREYAGGDFKRPMIGASYGYIRDTETGDGEELDVYLGEHPDAKEVYIVAQLTGDYEVSKGTKPGSFDEFKIVAGASSIGEAEALYKLHMPESQFGGIWAVPVDEFIELMLPLMGGLDRTASASHYTVDQAAIDNALELYNDEEGKQESIDETGRYEEARFEVVPISSIASREVWAPAKKDDVLRAMKEGKTLPPIRLTQDEKGLTISDGIHRIQAANEMGFTHVPAIILKRVEATSNDARLARVHIGSIKITRKGIDGAQSSVGEVKHEEDCSRSDARGCVVDCISRQGLLRTRRDSGSSNEASRTLPVRRHLQRAGGSSRSRKYGKIDGIGEVKHEKDKLILGEGRVLVDRERRPSTLRSRSHSGSSFRTSSRVLIGGVQGACGDRSSSRFTRSGSRRDFKNIRVRDFRLALEKAGFRSIGWKGDHEHVKDDKGHSTYIDVGCDPVDPNVLTSWTIQQTGMSEAELLGFLGRGDKEKKPKETPQVEQKSPILTISGEEFVMDPLPGYQLVYQTKDVVEKLSSGEVGVTDAFFDLDEAGRDKALKRNAQLSRVRVAMPMPSVLPEGWRVEETPMSKDQRSMKFSIVTPPEADLAGRGRVGTAANIMIYRPEDSDSWNVIDSSGRHGWGAFLYNYILKWVTARGEFFRSDQEVSDAAANVWNKFYERDDVEKTSDPKHVEHIMKRRQEPSLQHKYRMKQADMSSRVRIAEDKHEHDDLDEAIDEINEEAAKQKGTPGAVVFASSRVRIAQMSDMRMFLGHWISPDGQWHDVTQDHLGFAKKMLGEGAEDEREPLKELLRRGWIRISGPTGMQALPEAVSLTTLMNAMRTKAKELDVGQQMFVDLSLDHSRTQGLKVMRPGQFDTQDLKKFKELFKGLGGRVASSRVRIAASQQDIIVAIPRSRQRMIEEEEKDVAEREANGEKGLRYFWEMKRLPRQTPRRMYFIWDGAARAYHEVLEVSQNVNGAGGRIYMSTKIHEIDPIEMRGFQGFRYFDEAEARDGAEDGDDGLESPEPVEGYSSGASAEREPVVQETNMAPTELPYEPVEAPRVASSRVRIIEAAMLEAPPAMMESVKRVLEHAAAHFGKEDIQKKLDRGESLPGEIEQAQYLLKELPNYIEKMQPGETESFPVPQYSPGSWSEVVVWRRPDYASAPGLYNVGYARNGRRAETGFEPQQAMPKEDALEDAQRAVETAITTSTKVLKRLKETAKDDREGLKNLGDSFLVGPRNKNIDEAGDVVVARIKNDLKDSRYEQSGIDMKNLPDTVEIRVFKGDHKEKGGHWNSAQNEMSLWLGDHDFTKSEGIDRAVDKGMKTAEHELAHVMQSWFMHGKNLNAPGGLPTPVGMDGYNPHKDKALSHSKRDIEFYPNLITELHEFRDWASKNGGENTKKSIQRWVEYSPRFSEVKNRDEGRWRKMVTEFTRAVKADEEDPNSLERRVNVREPGQVLKRQTDRREHEKQLQENMKKASPAVIQGLIEDAFKLNRREFQNAGWQSWEQWLRAQDDEQIAMVIENEANLYPRVEPLGDVDMSALVGRVRKSNGLPLKVALSRVRIAGTVPVIDTEGNKGGARLTDIRAGDRMRFVREYEFKEGRKTFTVPQDSVGVVNGADQSTGLVTMRVQTKEKKSKLLSFSESTISAPASVLELIVSSDDPRAP